MFGTNGDFVHPDPVSARLCYTASQTGNIIISDSTVSLTGERKLCRQV